MNSSIKNVVGGNLQEFLLHDDIDNSYGTSNSNTTKEINYSGLPFSAKNILDSVENLDKNETGTEQPPLDWNNKCPEQWTADLVLKWIKHCIKKYNFEGAEAEETFRLIDGQQLCNMTENDFVKLDKTYGKKLHESLQNLLRNIPNKAPTWVDNEGDLNCHENHPDLITLENVSAFSTMQNYRLIEINKIPPRDIYIDHSNNLMNFDDYDDDDVDDQHYYNHPHLVKSSKQLIKNGNTTLNLSSSNINNAYNKFNNNHTNNNNNNNNGNNNSIRNRTSTNTGVSNRKTKPVIVRTASTRGRKPGQLSKGNHLWEFLRDLLHNPDTNPELVRWEDKHQGIFRIVKSEEVASKWGSKKKRPKMTYEKMSRAMRFCRDVGYFMEVPKDGKYPKKLVFRFGCMAKGWQRPDPNDINNNNNTNTNNY